MPSIHQYRSITAYSFGNKLFVSDAKVQQIWARLNISPIEKFDRTQLRILIYSLLGKCQLDPTDASLFANPLSWKIQPDANGMCTVPPDWEPRITLDLCDCAVKRWGFYVDAPSRMIQWTFPILLLLSNIEISSIDKWRFLTVVHALGDPIDSLWSVIYKLSSLDQAYAIAEKFHSKSALRDISEGHMRIIGTVLAGFEEIMSSAIAQTRKGCRNAKVQKFGSAALNELYTCIQAYGSESLADFYTALALHLNIRSLQVDGNDFQIWRRTACDLADARTNELPRAILSVVVYFFQIACALVPALGSESENPPGGRIGLALLLSWLIPLVFFTNTIGGITSGRSSVKIMDEFLHQYKSKATPSSTADEVGLNDNELRPVSTGSSELEDSLVAQRETWKEYFQSLQWRGAIYTYQPWKTLAVYSSSSSPVCNRCLFIVIVMVMSCFVGCFTILWNADVPGFSCRHVAVSIIFLLWILSVFLTHFSYKFLSGRKHWWFVMLKDTVIGGITVGSVVLMTAGIFSSCYCWSAYLWLGEYAYVNLNSNKIYLRNGQKFYPIVVGICIGLQIALYGLCLVLWRRGLKTLRWSEKLRQKEWVEEVESRRRDVSELPVGVC